MGLFFFFFLGISDGPNVSALTNGLDTPEERYTKLKKVGGVEKRRLCIAYYIMVHVAAWL